MRNQDVFGYILMEGNMDDSNKVSNIEVIKDQHLFYVRFDTVLQSFNRPNRNRRWYALDAVREGLDGSDKIQELIANGKWMGEAGHPITDDIRRVSIIDPTMTCHKMVKYWFDGELLKATIETLDDGMLGTKLTKSIVQGMNPSFSLRALAKLEKEKNISYVRQTPHVVTYDEVILPSHKEAYGMKDTQKRVSTSFNSKQEIIYENGCVPILTKTVADFVKSKSDNLKIICESFDVLPENLSLTNNGNALSMKQTSTGQTYVFTLEQTVAKEIRNFWITH